MAVTIPREAEDRKAVVELLGRGLYILSQRDNTLEQDLDILAEEAGAYGIERDDFNSLLENTDNFAQLSILSNV